MQEELAARLARAGVEVPRLEPLPLAGDVTAMGFPSSGTEAVDWWRRLHAVAGRTGCRPVLIPGGDRFLAPAGDTGDTGASRLEDRLEDKLEDGAALDAGTILNPKGSWADLDPHARQDMLDRWPPEPRRLDTFGLPYGRDGGPAPVDVALVVAEHGWRIPAIVNFGGWNACPPAAVHGAVLRYWSGCYGAELACLSWATVELALARPPRTRPEAMALAWEYATYCLDGMSLYDADDIPDLAACLIDAGVVRCWWD
jgi:hypothetical protein